PALLGLSRKRLIRPLLPILGMQSLRIGQSGLPSRAVYPAPTSDTDHQREPGSPAPERDELQPLHVTASIAWAYSAGHVPRCGFPGLHCLMYSCHAPSASPRSGSDCGSVHSSSL